jgi:hypothetical protein
MYPSSMSKKFAPLNKLKTSSLFFIVKKSKKEQFFVGHYKGSKGTFSNVGGKKWQDKVCDNEAV